MYSYYWVVLLIAASIPVGLPAQESENLTDSNAHSWYMYFGDHPFSEGSRWGLHFDGQVRRQGIGQNWQQYLLRPGINFDISDNVQVTGGYAYIQSYPYGDYPSEFRNPEHRIWQQLILKHKAGKVGLTHRYRLEQRFIGSVVADENGEGQLDHFNYKNRFRYFLKGVIPLRKDAEGRNKLYVGLYNEIMINFGSGSRNNVFDQNRAYGALGFRLGNAGNLEVGYLQQTVQKNAGRLLEYNHTLQVGFFSTVPFK